MQFRLHICYVTHPISSGGTIIKSIGIRINIDAFPMAQYHSTKHFFKFCIRISQLDIRPYLGSRIAQPHGVDITGINKRIVFTVQFTIMYCSIQCIGKTIFKHPSQIRIGQHFFYFRYFLLYDIRYEQSFLFLRTAADILSDIITYRNRIISHTLHNGITFCRIKR